jgi:hypothetical protein
MRSLPGGLPMAQFLSGGSEAMEVADSASTSRGTVFPLRRIRIFQRIY